MIKDAFRQSFYCEIMLLIHIILWVVGNKKFSSFTDNLLVFFFHSFQYFSLQEKKITTRNRMDELYMDLNR